MSDPNVPKKIPEFLNNKSVMIFDVQSFLIENKEAILSFLQNVPESANLARMPRERSPSRSVSRSLSPVVRKSNGKRGGRSPSRSISPSPPPMKARRSLSRSVSRSPVPRHRSRSHSGTPVYSSSRHRNGRDRSPSPVYSSSRHRGRDRSRSPYGGRGGGRYRSRSPRRSYRSGGRDFRNIKYADGRDRAEPCRCIGIFGMSLNTDESDLRRIFEEFGEIETTKVVRDHASGRSRGFAFIYFDRTEDAMRAKRAMSDATIDGMRVRVDYSVTHGAPSYDRGSRGGGGRYERSRSPMYRRRSRSRS